MLSLCLMQRNESLTKDSNIVPSLDFLIIYSGLSPVPPSFLTNSGVKLSHPTHPSLRPRERTQDKLCAPTSVHTGVKNKVKQPSHHPHFVLLTGAGLLFIEKPKKCNRIFLFPPSSPARAPCCLYLECLAWRTQSRHAV